MPGQWKRPESVAYPQVWLRFEGKREIEGRIPRFWVQDLPPDMFEKAIEVMCSNFIYDEPLCKHINLAEDAVAVEEIKETWRELVNQRVALICFMENPDPSGEPIIVGLNMTYVSEKGEHIPPCKSAKWQQVLDTVLYLCDSLDVFSELDIPAYLGALGLSVLPPYRGQAIGLEILNARSALCRAVGLPATLTVFTATASQRLADKSGFKDLVSKSYREISESEPRLTFPGIETHTTHIRYMYKMVRE